MDETDPLFITEPSDQANIARAYNALIAADGRSISGCLKFGLFFQLGWGGQALILGDMTSAKTRFRASILAFEDCLLVQDRALNDIEKSGKHKWAWTTDFAIKGGFRSIGNRKAIWRDQEYVRFGYDEIVAAFYSNEMIVLRFCWGEKCWDTWDVIIGPDDFTRGTLNAFLEMVEPFYKGKEVTDNLERSKRHQGIRLTNDWANPQLAGAQHKVMIYDRRHAWIP